MFKYTRASVNMLVDDCKKYAKIFKYVSLVATLLLLCYQLITGIINTKPLLPVYIGLFLAFIVFTVLDFVFSHKKLNDAKKISKRIYSWIKIFTKAFMLGVTLYEISVATEFDGIQIILTTLTIVLWILSIAVEIISEVVEARATEIMIAVKEDVEEIKKPITTVSNAFKKITGREVEPIPEKDSKTIKILDKIKKHISEKTKNK